MICQIYLFVWSLFFFLLLFLANSLFRTILTFMCDTMNSIHTHTLKQLVFAHIHTHLKWCVVILTYVVQKQYNVPYINTVRLCNKWIVHLPFSNSIAIQIETIEIISENKKPNRHIWIVEVSVEETANRLFIRNYSALLLLLLSFAFREHMFEWYALLFSFLFRSSSYSIAVQSNQIQSNLNYENLFDMHCHQCGTTFYDCTYHNIHTFVHTTH